MSFYIPHVHFNNHTNLASPHRGQTFQKIAHTLNAPSSTDTHYVKGYIPVDYNEFMHASLLFYEAQRSGPILDSTRIGWRGDSGLQDGCDNGVDLTGGYYDGISQYLLK